MDINNKVAIITGGASGLGHSTARNLVARGAKVMIFDVNEENAQKVCDELGKNSFYATVDVTDESSVRAGIEKAMNHFGAIHICVNCAGVGTPQKTLGRSGPALLENFKKVVDINLNGTFNVLRLAAQEMVKNDRLTDSGEKGIIVNTASVAAFDGQMGQAAYGASKAGIAGMTLPVARDLSGHGIRINTIAPGLFRTPLAETLDQKVIDKLEQSVEFPKRLGKPDEYASLVLFMIENEYINGEVIRLDGGIRMSPR
ncbi:3-hydroxyacyl-CoA dehydrogenase [Sporosarcina sp. P34]|uniref:3-hydroxyacyl-CoA dehydrogenase n=1 Tax=Sporosarcina sp. P34 TaxID=2048247 RepID=UPI000C1674E5|nr:3-hydroxyacyl-CoA dehydrogenase [Sporosarcina sp. P34]PID13866.1 3-hydroxyacyl-CoA dehydrogenase [Sporosarcina sp. P34]